MTDKTQWGRISEEESYSMNIADKAIEYLTEYSNKVTQIKKLWDTSNMNEFEVSSKLENALFEFRQRIKDEVGYVLYKYSEKVEKLSNQLEEK